jgi:hypothetical protein
MSIEEQPCFYDLTKAISRLGHLFFHSSAQFYGFSIALIRASTDRFLMMIKTTLLRALRRRRENLRRVASPLIPWQLAPFF